MCFLLFDNRVLERRESLGFLSLACLLHLKMLSVGELPKFREAYLICNRFELDPNANNRACFKTFKFVQGQGRRKS